MQNKGRKGTDVQWVISSVSLAITLGLWGLFAGGEKKTAGVAAQIAGLVPSTDQVIVSQPGPMLAPGQVLLFGGTAPQPQQQIVVTRNHNGGGGGGPVVSTGSSKP